MTSTPIAARGTSTTAACTTQRVRRETEEFIHDDRILTERPGRPMCSSVDWIASRTSMRVDRWAGISAARKPSPTPSTSTTASSPSGGLNGTEVSADWLIARTSAQPVNAADEHAGDRAE